MPRQCKLKRAVIKEELFALTGDDLSAIILNQFLYWSERTRDFDKFIAEEKERDPSSSMTLTHGWIYKSADELKDEIMTSASVATIRRRIKDLVSDGWLQERNNPILKWDRTLQYRPDIHKIQSDLTAIGYSLEGYPLQIKDCILHCAECNIHDASCIMHDVEAIPETTTETTPKTTTEKDSLSEFPATENPLSESNLPSEPANGKSKKVPGKTYLDAIAEFSDRQAEKRPKGWEGADSAIFTICEQVARLWFGGHMPTGLNGSRIEQWRNGAMELLELHDSNLQTTKETIDSYFAYFESGNNQYNVSSPSSLVGSITRFIAQGKPKPAIQKHLQANSRPPAAAIDPNSSVGVYLASRGE